MLGQRYFEFVRSWLPSKDRRCAEAAVKMERDWDTRARQNARYYVATSRESWSDESFFRSGAIWVDDYILSDLTAICNGRMPCEMRVLEIGCGAGRLLPALARLFGEVHGVDVSREMLEHARRAVAPIAKIHLHKNSGFDLQIFQDEQFDFAFSAIVFQHIPSKTIVKKYIQEACRVLRPGSIFKFQVQGTRIAERHADTWQGVGFSEREMNRYAEDAGFTILKVEGIGTQYFWLTFLKPHPSHSPF